MNSKNEVRRMLLEGLSASQITTELGGLLARASVLRYIQDLVKAMSEAELRQLTDARLARSSAAPRRSRSFADQKVISPMHIRIGAKISWHRNLKDMEPTEYAARNPFCNRVSLRQMEHGLYDFRLSELQTIAKVLGTDLPGLLEPPKPKIIP